MNACFKNECDFIIIVLATRSIYAKINLWKFTFSMQQKKTKNMLHSTNRIFFIFSQKLVSLRITSSVEEVKKMSYFLTWNNVSNSIPKFPLASKCYSLFIISLHYVFHLAFFFNWNLRIVLLFKQNEQKNNRLYFFPHNFCFSNKNCHWWSFWIVFLYDYGVHIPWILFVSEYCIFIKI